MRGGAGRTAGILALVVSSLWALGATSAVVFGVLLFLSGRDSDASVDVEGFAEFVGGGLAVVGGIVLAAAIAGIVLGIRLARRGGGGVRIALAVIFIVYAMVSGLFLMSALADESGVDVGGVAMFGLNTAVCVAVVILSFMARPDG